MPKHLDCAYIYSDGHAVEVWKERIKHQEISWVVIRERYARCLYKGRIGIGAGQIALYRALQGAQIEAKELHISHGSQRTKSLGLRVGYLMWINRQGESAHVCDMDGLSGPYFYQDNLDEAFTDVKDSRWWGDYPVEKIVPAKER